MAKNEIDEETGVETTGHEWDGIKELNNPLPRWWLWTFYASVVFSIGYVIYYPAIPLIEGSTPGLSGETTRGLLHDELRAVKKSQSALVEEIVKSDLATIQKTDKLYRFSLSAGASHYKVNCSQCHGSGAEGGPGYPNLNDDDWLWGGSLQEIYTTIKHGVRSQEDDDTRFSEMPAFGDLLSDKNVADVAQYVLQFSGHSTDAAAATRGADVYASNCASCHGDKGEGIRETGSPRLNDALWLYGRSPELIARQIKKPRHGVMPPWGARLGDVAVKQLAIYVHSLGGGEVVSSTGAD